MEIRPLIKNMSPIGKAFYTQNSRVLSCFKYPDSEGSLWEYEDEIEEREKDIEAMNKLESLGWIPASSTDTILGWIKENMDLIREITELYE